MQEQEAAKLERSVWLTYFNEYLYRNGYISDEVRAQIDRLINKD